MSAAEKVQHADLVATVRPGKWVRDRLLFPLFGITPEMARKYRERGVWLEDKHWMFDPLHRVVYNPSEIENWFEGKL